MALNLLNSLISHYIFLLLAFFLYMPICHPHQSSRHKSSISTVSHLPVCTQSCDFLLGISFSYLSVDIFLLAPNFVLLQGHLKEVTLYFLSSLSITNEYILLIRFRTPEELRLYFIFCNPHSLKCCANKSLLTSCLIETGF